MEAIQHYRFNSHSRKPGETITVFVLELHSLAEFSNFDTTLDDMLQDHLLCGINNSKIQQKLLAEKTDLTKALELAQVMETAAKNIYLCITKHRKCESIDTSHLWEGYF